MSSIICNVDTSNSQYFENSPLTTFSNVSNVAYLMPNSFKLELNYLILFMGYIEFFLNH